MEYLESLTRRECPKKLEKFNQMQNRFVISEDASTTNAPTAASNPNNEGTMVVECVYTMNYISRIGSYMCNLVLYHAVESGIPST
mmetsp:Transcript_12566/g.15594  ORF Transcript_12566/g.15594 Transcript_12566/m.15594 type:complete len:85 (-) Transcript_12566:222-476(-)